MTDPATGSAEPTAPRQPEIVENDTTGYRERAENQDESSDDVLAQNVEESANQVENKGQVEDPGQLSEDLQGDYQRRVQMGVNPSDLTYDDDEVEDLGPEEHRVDEDDEN